MREIKFRWWDNKYKVMVNDIRIAPEYNWLVLADNDAMAESDYKDGTLLQFTGLHDKNGKEIWQGDVVKLPGTINKEMHGEFSFWEVTLNTIVPILSYVKSEKETHIPRAYMTSELADHFYHESLAFGENPQTDDLEVIGNVFSNPELLK